MLFGKHRCYLDGHEPRDVLDTCHVTREAILYIVSSAPNCYVLNSVFKSAFYTPVNQPFYTPVNQPDLTIFPFYPTFLHKAEVSTPLGKNTFLSNRQSE